MNIWESPEFDEHEHISVFADQRVGLKAIVAIHSTRLGPAVGGTRFWPYPDHQHAVDDVLRLSRAMSYKCALGGVSLGGGKAVIIGDPRQIKTTALLESYAAFLNRIGSSYTTGEDVGFSLADIEVVRKICPYVGGTASAGAGDPGIHTAHGVFHGIRATLQARLGRDDFKGVHVAVQGLGSVGWRLCGWLHEAGARLTVADIDAERVSRARTTFDAQSVAADRIHATEADVFAPCALGGILNERTVHEIQAPVVAGAANNQLASPECGAVLHQRGILYAPDYVINGGGIIGALEELASIPGRSIAISQPVEARLRGIGARLTQIFERAKAEGTAPEVSANRMGREMIGR
jgi:leucine dehydrogenase